MEHESTPPPSPSPITYTKSLIQRLERQLQEEIDAEVLADLKWGLKIIHEAQTNFLDVEKMFEAHHLMSMPYAIMKLEQDKFMVDLMPNCIVEELGRYAPLTKSQINGDELLNNQPPWWLKYINDHTQAILEYAKVPCSYRIDPRFCPRKRCYEWSQFDRQIPIFSIS